MLQARDIDLRVLDMRTRIPFRYGITTLRACPHLFLKFTFEIDGRRVAGIAADHLPPKWFTKDPGSSFADDLKDMIGLIRHAADHAVLAGRQADVYALVSRVYAEQTMWAAEKGYPPLLYNHGVSLVERAAIDALCRARRVTFARAVRENLLGIRFSGFADERLMLDYQELGNTSPAGWLPPAPLRQVIARHTVGLLDPLVDADIPPADRVDDGLPQSLEAAVARYGLTHFKLKIAGDPEADLDRLRRVFALLDRRAPADWAFTLDGNENYRSVGPFRQLWDSLRSDDTLRPHLRRLIFVEQPLHRDVALGGDVKRDLAAWPDRPAIIIDESDGAPGDCARALACGYAGTSHKNCKGVIKGIANACLLAKRRQDEPTRAFVLSGEDLVNVGPVALLQDLAVCATLGITSVERNGHHYFRGLSMYPPALRAQVSAHRGDLYTGDLPTLDIRGGRLDLGSVVDAPFGVAFDVDLAPFTPLRHWTFDPAA